MHCIENMRSFCAILCIATRYIEMDKSYWTHGNKNKTFHNIKQFTSRIKLGGNLSVRVKGKG